MGPVTRIPNRQTIFFHIPAIDRRDHFFNLQVFLLAD